MDKSMIQDELGLVDLTNIPLGALDCIDDAAMALADELLLEQIDHPSSSSAGDYNS